MHNGCGHAFSNSVGTGQRPVPYGAQPVYSPMHRTVLYGQRRAAVASEHRLQHIHKAQAVESGDANADMERRLHRSQRICLRGLLQNMALATVAAVLPAGQQCIVVHVHADWAVPTRPDTGHMGGHGVSQGAADSPRPVVRDPMLPHHRAFRYSQRDKHRHTVLFQRLCRILPTRLLP